MSVPDNLVATDGGATVAEKPDQVACSATSL